MRNYGTTMNTHPIIEASSLVREQNFSMMSTVSKIINITEKEEDL